MNTILVKLYRKARKLQEPFETGKYCLVFFGESRAQPAFNEHYYRLNFATEEEAEKCIAENDFYLRYADGFQPINPVDKKCITVEKIRYLQEIFEEPKKEYRMF